MLDLENLGPGDVEFVVRERDGAVLQEGPLGTAHSEVASTEGPALTVVLEAASAEGAMVSWSARARGGVSVVWDLSEALPGGNTLVEGQWWLDHG